MDIKIIRTITLEPGKIQIVSAGIKTVIPEGWHAKVYARSGLPTKQGCTLANAVAILDADYRGEYLLQLRNISDQTQTIEQGTRVAQLEFCPSYLPQEARYDTKEVPRLEMKVDRELYEKLDTIFPSDRGIGAFHSTGK